MLSLFDINLIKVELGTIGPSFRGVGVVGEGSEKVTPTWPPDNLVVPWQDLPRMPNLFSLLSWHTGVSGFVGRAREMENLSTWAESIPAVSVDFITGDAGVGKSRLAAEFATELQKRGWSAGFVNLRMVHSFPLKKEGTLLVVDYPEESYSAGVELLSDLARLDRSHHIRALFLTRRDIAEWQQAIYDANAAPIVDMNPVVLQGLSKAASHKLFCSAQERVAEVMNTVPIPVSEDDLGEWIHSAPENSRAPFLLAAAVCSAIDVDSEVLNYSRREIVEALVQPESSRLRRIAENYGFRSRTTLAELLALAAFAGELPLATVDKLIELPNSRLDFPANRDRREILEEAGLMKDGIIPSPKPDILAAAFATIVLKDEPQLAPELIWATIEQDLEASLERLARLSYDAEVVIGLHGQRISLWLAEALKNRPDRCSIIDKVFARGRLPLGWHPAAVVAWGVLLPLAADDEEKGRLLNNLSTLQRDSGDTARALDTIREAVEIYRRLATAKPVRFEPDLATSLNNLATMLSDVGDTVAALDVIQEAVEIRRRLAAADPVVFEPDLGRSLNNLSNMLSVVGDTLRALDTIQEAVEIHRRLVAANPDHFEPDLAGSLNNLASRLSDVGDKGHALDAIQEAVEIYRRLAAANPAAFEPDLAMSLNNLSNSLSDLGDRSRALDAIKEALEIYRRLAAANPARFELDLAGSLNNLSNRLSDIGDTSGALDAIQEAVEIYRRSAAANPAAFEPDLAGSLNNLSNMLSNIGDTSRALDAIKEALEIYRRLAAADPVPFEPDLAGSLNNLSNMLSDIGDRSRALDAIKEALEIYRRLAAAAPARFEPDLARSLNNLSVRLGDVGDRGGALDAIKEAVGIYRRLAAANPAPFEPDLAGSLNNLSNIVTDVGDTSRALDAIKEALEIYRRLAATNPTRFEPDLARSYGALGAALRSLGHMESACDALKQGVRLLQVYAKESPDHPYARLRTTLLEDLNRMGCT